MSRRSKVVGKCPYCGREKHLTKEHVVPQTLFRTLDPEMPVVYICYQCNNEMSPGIRDLRNWLVLSIESIRHPDWMHHLEKMVLSNEATQNWLKGVMENAETIDFVTESGLVVGQGLLHAFNKERARRALSRIVRGLYLIEGGAPLPVEVTASAIELDPRIARQFVARLMPFDHGDPVTKGNDVVTWIPYLNIGGEGPESTAWLLFFFDSVCFLGGTGTIGDRLEEIWQQSIQDSGQYERIDGRVQLKAPKLPDGSYWIPPGAWAE
jgi:hypothetical protein